MHEAWAGYLQSWAFEELRPSPGTDENGIEVSWEEEGATAKAGEVRRA